MRVLALTLMVSFARERNSRAFASVIESPRGDWTDGLGTTRSQSAGSRDGERTDRHSTGQESIKSEFRSASIADKVEHIDDEFQG